jgi:cell division protein FtsL
MEFISHCIKRNPYKLEGRATAGMLIIFLILSLLGWIYLTQASHVATTSRRNQELETEKARLQQENMELMVEIATYESVSRLAARAEELGFVAVTPDNADYMALVAPAPSAPGLSPAAISSANVGRLQGLQGAVAHAQPSGPGSHPGAPNSSSLDSDVIDPKADPTESAEVPSALGARALVHVKSQFAAWIRANQNPSASHGWAQ